MPKIRRFTGINNVQPSVHARLGDLQTANNVLITDRGAIKRRLGLSLGIDATADDTTHSVWDDGTYLYYVMDSDLKRVSSVGGGVTTIHSSLSAPSAQMHYIKLEGITYYSNGTDYGKVQSNGTVTTSIWGSTAPSFSIASGSGTVPIGTYQVLVTGVYADGRETPAAVDETTLAAIGGFTVNISAHSDTLVTTFNVYVTRPDGGAGDSGEASYKFDNVANSGGASVLVNSLASDDIDGGRAGTLNMAGMPHGKFPCFYRGRLYCASGSYIFYSEPWMYELTKADHNFIPAGGTVTNIMPVENGIWVSTNEESFFMFGKGPQDEGGFEKISSVSGWGVPGGVVTNGDKLNLRNLSGGKVAIWPTKTGIIVGDANGRFMVRTREFWVPPSSTGTSGYIRDIDGEYAYLFNVGTDTYAINLMTAAVTKFSTVCNSFAGLGGVLIAGHSKGVCEVDDPGENDFDGEVFEANIAATITKSGIDFDDNHIKKITDMFLHMLSDGNLSIQVASESGNGTVTLTDGIDTLHGSKADLPRGVKGRNLSFTISNLLGVYFEIHEIDIETEVSQIRRGRQTSG
jgi:hypothetical protein